MLHDEFTILALLDNASSMGNALNSKSVGHIIIGPKKIKDFNGFVIFLTV